MTDRLVAVLELLARAEFKKATLTWDRIEDDGATGEPGAIVVPILILER